MADDPPVGNDPGRMKGRPMSTHKLQTVFVRFDREIPDLGLCSGYYELEGEVAYELNQDRIEFVDIDIVVRLLPQDPGSEDTHIWEWKSSGAEDSQQSRKDLERAREILENSFSDDDHSKCPPTLAEKIRQEIEEDDFDVNYVLRQFER